MKKNEIQRLMDDNFKAMSDKTKEKLYGVSNAVFIEKKFQKGVDNLLKVSYNRKCQKVRINI